MAGTDKTAKFDIKLRDGAAQEGAAAAFEPYRRLLFAIAYRMVGTVMEAEDIVQEAFLRYQAALPARIDNLKGYLTTITTRLCLDYLKAAQTQRQRYFGIWLPEPVAGDVAIGRDDGAAALHHELGAPPDDVITQQESISMAFLVILQQLTPVERAVLLLRGVFDYEYAEISQMVGKSEANCRQIFHRAQRQVRSERPRFDVPAETHAAMVMRFIQAVDAGELDGLVQLLTDDVAMLSDSGGKASAALLPVVGAAAVARLWLGLAAKGRHLYTAAAISLNGQLGIVLYNLAGEPETVITFDVVSDEAGEARIAHLYAMRNPDKLAKLPRSRGAAQGESPGDDGH